MPVSLGRLALLALTALVVAAMGFLGWRLLAAKPKSDFQQQAEAICRDSFPAIINAATFDDAMAASRTLRLKLSMLTPPAEDRGVFTNWLAALKGAEDAALRGDTSGAQMADVIAQRDERELGVADGCIQHVGS